MASVVFDNVSKVFPDGTRAISGVSLEIGDGELLVLVGPSGCGKSTLLRMLAGLDAPTSGTIRIGGRVVNDSPPQERNVAMVFQDYALYPHMTVRRNLEFPLRMRRMSRREIDERITRVAELLGIGALLDRLPKQLSGGQRQRVAMGRALVREPSVSLLDEPLSNLDAKLRVQVRAEIADLQRRTAITMLYVTHDQVEAMTLGQRVAVLDRGVLQQVAPPHDLYHSPANAFVAGFIGNPPMNLFRACFAVERNELMIVVAGQRLVLGSTAGIGPGSGQITAGVRPEALRVATSADATRLAAAVEHLEYLGHETLVHARLLGEGETPRLIARLDGTHTFTRGERVDLSFNPAQLRFFGADGRALPVRSL